VKFFTLNNSQILESMSSIFKGLASKMQ